jgi:hypothetical protein
MKSPSPPGIFPVRAFDVRMEKDAYDRFIVQMREFGTAFDFRMVIKPSSPRPYDMYFQMWRPDVEVSSANISGTGATDLKFDVLFYPKRDQPPPTPENAAALVDGLRQFLNEVPGAVVTEVTRPRQRATMAPDKTR